MWGGVYCVCVCVWWVLVGSGYLKIKNSKNLALVQFIHSVLADLKNCLVLGLRNLKRGGYVVRVRFLRYVIN